MITIIPSPIQMITVCATEAASAASNFTGEFSPSTDANKLSSFAKSPAFVNELFSVGKSNIHSPATNAISTSHQALFRKPFRYPKKNISARSNTKITSITILIFFSEAAACPELTQLLQTAAVFFLSFVKR